MTINKKPELLAPAGDLEKLKIAVNYGADAVYIGGKSLGLRAKAKNFDYNEMQKGIDYVHSHGKKIYVTANIFAHNDDFEGAVDYFKDLKKLNVDGVLISDPGLFSVARDAEPDLEIHISTQANNTNFHSALFWRKLGAKRIVLARELSLKEITEIRQQLPQDFEIEVFVHGAMCISYSGRCLLSNYLSGRDANKGECSHPCRWNYSLMEEKRQGEYFPVYEDERGTYIFNSKDLCMIQNIGDLVSAGINSLKIEGRMKTPYYVGTVIKAYRDALDDYFNDVSLYESKINHYITEIKKASHRDFTTGFYYGKPTQNEQIYTTNSYIRLYDFVGVVKSYDTQTGIATIEQRNKFVVGDEVEFLQPEGTGFKEIIKDMTDESGEPIQEAPHPQQIVKVKLSNTVKEFDMMRIEIK